MYEECLNQNGNVEQKRASRLTGTAFELDNRMYRWFVGVRARNIPINGPLVQTRALEVAKHLGLTDFKASNGWLESFRTRHLISFRNLSGESAGMDDTAVQSWKDRLPELFDGYALSGDDEYIPIKPTFKQLFSSFVVIQNCSNSKSSTTC